MSTSDTESVSGQLQFEDTLVTNEGEWIHFRCTCVMNSSPTQKKEKKKKSGFTPTSPTFYRCGDYSNKAVHVLTMMHHTVQWQTFIYVHCLYIAGLE